MILLVVESRARAAKAAQAAQAALHVDGVCERSICHGGPCELDVCSAKATIRYLRFDRRRRRHSRSTHWTGHGHLLRISVCESHTILGCAGVIWAGQVLLGGGISVMLDKYTGGPSGS